MQQMRQQEIFCKNKTSDSVYVMSGMFTVVTSISAWLNTTSTDVLIVFSHTPLYHLTATGK